MAADKPQMQIAVLMDFENVAMSAEEAYGDFDLHLLLEAIGSRGRISVKRAYGDWARLGNYRNILLEEAIELVQLYAVARKHGKNRADVRLAVDAMELIFTQQHINTIAVVSGDSDFSTLMSKVREYGKQTIGAGVRHSTSELLVKSCDEFIYYDDLVTYDIARAQDLLERIVEKLLNKAGQSVKGTFLKLQMLKVDPDFNERALRYGGFREFLEGQPHIVRVEVSHTDMLVYSAKFPALKPAELSSKGEGVKLGIPVQSVPDPPPEIQHAQVEPTAGDAPTDLSRYLIQIGMRPLPPPVRNEVMHDFLSLVPSVQTLNQVINELKARYDSTNIMMTREDLRDVIKLAYESGILTFGVELPSLGALIHGKVESDVGTVWQRADQVYLRKLLAAGFTLTPEIASVSCLAPANRAPYYDGLLETLRNEGVAKKESDGYSNAIPNLVERILNYDGLKKVRDDLDATSLPAGTPIERALADDLFKNASKVAGQDFSTSAQLGLRAAKILSELIFTRQPGNSPEELLWYLAIYCRAKSGELYYEKRLAAARDYYLALFAIMQEGSLPWERARALLRPSQSYYWALIATAFEITVQSIGYTSPERIILNIRKEQVGEKVDGALREMAKWLARANASLLRGLIESLSRVDEEQSLVQDTISILRASHDEVVLATAPMNPE